MADEYEVYVESNVHAYHMYFKDATVWVGEITCEIEEDNRYADIVMNYAGKIVGVVPIELSKLFTKFLGDYGEVEAKCSSNWYNAGRGKFTIPKETTEEVNISDIRKCQAWFIDDQYYWSLVQWNIVNTVWKECNGL